MECMKRDCKKNNNGECLRGIESCPSRIEPININYEEEYKKLKKEHETLLKEKKWSPSAFTQFNNLKYENSEYERINKELELQRDKLKAENKKILIENADLKELKASYEDSMEAMNEALIKLNKENEEAKKDNAKLRKANAINYDEYKEHLEALKEENKEKLENYKLLKRMIKVLIEGL